MLLGIDHFWLLPLTNRRKTVHARDGTSENLKAWESVKLNCMNEKGSRPLLEHARISIATVYASREGRKKIKSGAKSAREAATSLGNVFH